MTALTCDWLIERPIDTAPPADLSEEFLGDWYDQMNDLLIETRGVKIVECGAEVTEIVDGWQCVAGHRHFRYGSHSQQEEELEEAWNELHGYDRYAV